MTNMKKITLIIILTLIASFTWAERPKWNLIHMNTVKILGEQPSITVWWIGMDDCISRIDARLFIPVTDEKESYTLTEFVEIAKKTRGYNGETGSMLREFDRDVRSVIRKFKDTLAVGDFYFVHIIAADESQTIEVVLEITDADKSKPRYTVYPLGYLNGKHSR